MTNAFTQSYVAMNVDYKNILNYSENSDVMNYDDSNTENEMA